MCDPRALPDRAWVIEFFQEHTMREEPRPTPLPTWNEAGTFVVGSVLVGGAGLVSQGLGATTRATAAIVLITGVVACAAGPILRSVWRALAWAYDAWEERGTPTSRGAPMPEVRFSWVRLLVVVLGLTLVIVGTTSHSLQELDLGMLLLSFPTLFLLAIKGRGRGH